MSDEETAPEEATEKPKRSMPGFVVPLAMVIAGLGGGGFVGAKVVGPKLTTGIVQGMTTAEVAAHGGPKQPGEADAEHGEPKEGDAPAAVSPVYTISDLVLNPAGSGGTRFLMMSVTFDVRDSSSVEMLRQRDAEIKDAVLALVGARTVEELAEVSEREPLKMEINALVTRIVKKNLIKRVSFPQFVIQ